MEWKTVPIAPIPLALNVVDNKRQVSAEECIANNNIEAVGKSGLRGCVTIKNLECNLTNNQKILATQLMVFDEIGPQIFVWGQKTDGSYFYGYITDATFPDWEEMPNSYATPNRPTLLNFNRWVIITAPGYWLYKWDGTSGYDWEVGFLNTGVGCVYRDRLFLCEGAKVWYTEPGVLSFPIDHWFIVGRENDPITALIPMADKIIICKENETWELFYDWDWSTAQRRFRSNNAGCLNNQSWQTYNNMTIMYNKNDVFVLPENEVGIRTDNLLYVGNGIYKVSEKIKPLLANINLANIAKRFERHENWSLGDFVEHHNIAIGERPHFPGHIGVISEPSPDANRIAVARLPMLYKANSSFLWYKITYSVNPIFRFPLQQYPWMVIRGSSGATEVETVTTGEHGPYEPYKRFIFYIPGEMQEEDGLEITLFIPCPWIEEEPPEFYSGAFYDLEVTAKYNTIWSSGSWNNEFYMIGVDQITLVPVILKYNPLNGAWNTISYQDLYVYNFHNGFYFGDYNIVGGGQVKDSNKRACLLYTDIPETRTGDRSLIWESGEIDYGVHGVPKKVRKLLITYKSSNVAYLTIWNDYSTSQQAITLESTDSVFKFKEINLQEERTKFHRFRLTSAKGDFEINKMEVVVKFLPLQEL